MSFRALLVLLSFLASLAQGAEFKLYAAFTEDTRVELSDGAVWMMDKGDVFPVIQYKNMQKNVILQLAGATFMTDTARVRVLKADEVTAGIEVYRKNVRSYLDATSKKIEDRLKPAGAKPDPAPATPAPAAEPKPAEAALEPKPAAEPQKP